jgi:hypothetical protein
LAIRYSAISLIDSSFRRWRAMPGDVANAPLEGDRRQVALSGIKRSQQVDEVLIDLRIMVRGR